MQRSFSDLEYAAKKRVTRRERFLGEIDAVTPWSALIAEVAPFYPPAGPVVRESRPNPGAARKSQATSSLASPKSCVDQCVPRALPPFGEAFFHP